MHPQQPPPSAEVDPHSSRSAVMKDDTPALHQNPLAPIHNSTGLNPKAPPNEQSPREPQLLNYRLYKLRVDLWNSNVRHNGTNPPPKRPCRRIVPCKSGRLSLKAFS